jgi:hypothetical protein
VKFQRVLFIKGQHMLEWLLFPCVARLDATDDGSMSGATRGPCEVAVGRLKLQVGPNSFCATRGLGFSLL